MRMRMLDQTQESRCQRMLTHAGFTANADLAMRVYDFMKARGMDIDAQVWLGNCFPNVCFSNVDCILKLNHLLA
jgi:hypothetical protein